MHLRSAILRDLKTGPSAFSPLAKRLHDHSREELELELEDMRSESLVEVLAVELQQTINVYRLTEKGFQS